MLVFSDAFITDLHRLDLYHYTFAGLAGLLRLEQVQDEPTLLGTENVIRAVMKITPNHLKTNSSFRRELQNYITQQVDAKHAFLASARYCTVMDELAKKMIYETLNAEMKADVDSEFTQSTKSQTGYTYHELLLFLHNTCRDYLDD